jgi:hypothetical protein
MRVQMVPIDGLNDPVPTLIEDGDSDDSVDDLLSTSRSRATVSPTKLRELVLRELASGEKSRDYLNQVAADALGASADMLYRNAISPLRADGEIKARKDGLEGGWYWRLTDDGIPF